MSEKGWSEDCRAGSPNPTGIRQAAGSIIPPYRLARYLLAGLAALLPKCLACVAGYLTLGAGLAAKTPEWCGAADDASWSPGWFVVTVTAFLVGVSWLLAGQRVRGIQDGENTKKQSS